MPVTLDLSDRTAIVTGSGRGIGRTIAVRFADAGANVVTAARTEDEISETADQAAERGVETLAAPTDLSDPNSIDALVDRTVEDIGVPDILVNNAAANFPGNPVEYSLTDLDTMIDVNFRGLFLLSQRVAQELRADSRAGRIVNVSSIGATLGIPNLAMYGATKAGVNGLTRGLAAELAPDGTTVNAVSPGLTRTERIDNVIEEHDLYDLDRIPLKRTAKPQEIADSCLFFTSDLASYITGQELVVDGGVTFTAGLYK